IDAEPCGFCGEEGKCLTSLINKKKGGLAIVSTCQYQHSKMKYKAASTFKPSANPCTNVPIHCILC
ncbi:hypothetical protein BDQ17DRAFT_1183624, partial [Cyathus striatus]